MSILRPQPTESQTQVGLLVLRLVLGVVFIMHGQQKLFSYGVDGVAGGFAESGIPMAGAMAALVTGIEFLGGIAILLGVLTRFAAVGIAAVMIGAIMFVHAPAGFFAPEGFEFPLSLMGMAATLAITGAGAYSLDALLERRTPAPPEAIESRSPADRRTAA